MKKLLILLFLLPTFLFAQKREKVFFQNSIFKGEYSEVLEQPLWVEYVVKCPNGTASRSGMDFFTNDTIHTSNNLDYENNVYDKGHLAPAADFNCNKEMLLSTFSYLNCCLQNQYLNRGTWRLLEAHERELAKTSTVSVKILLVFDKTSILLPTGATVPSGFYKYVTVNGVTTKYFFKNEKPTSSDFKLYIVK
jgi:endonuclease G